MPGMTAAVSGRAPAGGRMLAERGPAVLLQAELRNFTRLSEVLDPERVLQLASAFFTLAAASVKAQNGEICSVQNDGVVAAFRGARPAQCAASGLAAAQALLRDFAPMGERWQADFGLPAALAIGLHCGETLFGMAGPKGGEQYVAFGHSIGIAERLVHRARAGEIVLSADAVKALGPAAADLGAKALPPLEFGRGPALPIYGIVLETRLDFT
ncbi:MAG: adenylate/guanylate cyclase domain-containing protein [Betaproteobacteria bacterium]|nr:adenylate/guanylate cyclase domain-containing protein [Betaproteobacteria bacterium]